MVVSTLGGGSLLVDSTLGGGPLVVVSTLGGDPLVVVPTLGGGPLHPWWLSAKASLGKGKAVPAIPPRRNHEANEQDLIS